MTLQTTFPIGSTILTVDGKLGKVIDYHGQRLMFEGIGKDCDMLGPGIANPDNSIRLADGHFGLVDNVEYFVVNDTLYRTTLDKAWDYENNCRMGGREVAPTRLLTSEYIRMLGL